MNVNIVRNINVKIINYINVKTINYFKIFLLETFILDSRFCSFFFAYPLVILSYLFSLNLPMFLLPR